MVMLKRNIFSGQSIQMGLANYYRKEFYKSAVQEEIRLRSPNTGGSVSPRVERPVGGSGGSGRPSVCSLVGQLSYLPYLRRHLSEVSLEPAVRHLQILIFVSQFQPRNTN